MGRRTASPAAAVAALLLLLPTTVPALYVPAAGRATRATAPAVRLDGAPARAGGTRLPSSAVGGVDGAAPSAAAAEGADGTAPPGRTHYDTVVVGESKLLSSSSIPVTSSEPLTDFLSSFW